MNIGNRRLNNLNISDIKYWKHKYIRYGKYTDMSKLVTGQPVTLKNIVIRQDVENYTNLNIVRSKLVRLIIMVFHISS